MSSACRVPVSMHEGEGQHSINQDLFCRLATPALQRWRQEEGRLRPAWTAGVGLGVGEVGGGNSNAVTVKLGVLWGPKIEGTSSSLLSCQ